MTRNQIDYWKLMEDQRSNLANEAETARSNRAKEAETERSNLAKEAETHRHNNATELIDSLGVGNEMRNANTREIEAQYKGMQVALNRDANRIREAELAVKQQEADTKRDEVTIKAAKVVADSTTDLIDALIPG